MGSNIVLIGKVMDYQSNFNLINLHIQKGLLKVVGIVLEDSIYESVDGIPVFSSLSEIKDMEFDYFILLTESKDYYTLISEDNDFKQDIIPVRVFKLPQFNFTKYQKLLENPPSIISRHCWGGLVFHRLGLKFKSPFVNLYLSEFDFNKLADNFSHYMNQELELIKEGYDPILKSHYPIVKLDDLTIHFNHYSSFDEAKNKWEERKNRLNYDNLLFETTTEYKSVAIQFNSLNLERKLCFCVDDIEGKGMINCVDMIPIFSKGKLGMFVNGTANGEIPLFNLVDLLLEDNLDSRITISKKSDYERAYNFYKTTKFYNMEYSRLFGLDDQLPWYLDDKKESFNFIKNLGVNYTKIYKLNDINDLNRIDLNDLPSRFYLKSSNKTSSNMMLLNKESEKDYVDELSSKNYNIMEIIDEINSNRNAIENELSYYLIEDVSGKYVENNKIPIEYKVFSLNGIPKIILQIIRGSNPVISLFDGNFIPLYEGRDWFINQDLAKLGVPIIPPSAYDIISQSIKVSKEVNDKFIITTWLDNGEEAIFNDLTFTSKELFEGMFSLSREVLLNLDNSLEQELFVDYIEKGYRIDAQKLHAAISTQLNYRTQEYEDILQKSINGDEEAIQDMGSYFENLSINEKDNIKKRLYQHLEIAWLENLLYYDEVSSEKICRQINAGWGFIFLKTFYYQQRIDMSKEVLYKKSRESDWYKVRWAQFVFDLGGGDDEIHKAKNYVNTFSNQGLNYAINVKNKYGI